MSDSPWLAAHQLLASDREPTADEAAIRDDVFALVSDWMNGLPLADVRRICTSRDRVIATRFGVGSPVFPDLMRMLDALIATDDSGQYGLHYQTPHGVFSEAELHETGARMSRTSDGKIRIEFPVLHPWRHKPDADRGFAGERGTPVYGDTPEERRAILSIHDESDRRTRRLLD